MRRQALFQQRLRSEREARARAAQVHTPVAQDALRAVDDRGVHVEPEVAAVDEFGDDASIWERDAFVVAMRERHLQESARARSREVWRGVVDDILQAAFAHGSIS